MKGIPQDHSEISHDRRVRFLTELTAGKSILEAAGNESVRRKLYRLRERDPKFQAAWDEAARNGLSKHRDRAAPWYRSAARAEKLGLVYFIGSRNPKLDLPIKIGWTGFDARIRLSECQHGSPVPLTLIATLAGPRSLETQLHRRFRSKRVHREWFAISRHEVEALLH